MQVAAADADDNHPHPVQITQQALMRPSSPHTMRRGGMETWKCGREGRREMKDIVTENSHTSIVFWQKNMIRDA